tara:strand:- start:8320 stop:8424 length:105 start_codon:yes stop_codon:yes gene_type:complete
MLFSYGGLIQGEIKIPSLTDFRGYNGLIQGEHNN